MIRPNSVGWLGRAEGLWGLGEDDVSFQIPNSNDSPKMKLGGLRHSTPDFNSRHAEVLMGDARRHV